MAFDPKQSLEVIEIMENYISRVRPTPDIRDQLDISYEMEDQSVILNEIRSMWTAPYEKLAMGYAKATFVSNKKYWKVLWKRADNKWHSYEPNPTVKKLTDFLKLVDEDLYGCFKG